MNVFNITSTLVASANASRLCIEKGCNNFDALVITDGADAEKFWENKTADTILGFFALKKIYCFPSAYVQTIKRIPASQVILLQGSEKEKCRTLVTAVTKNNPGTAFEAGQPVQAALFIRDGFDEEVFFAMRTQLQLAGKEPIILADRKSGIVSINGIRIVPDQVYTEAVAFADQTIIVAPGFFWPSTPADSIPYRWLTQQWKNGHQLVLFGTSAFMVGNTPVFKVIPFTTSDQMKWSFSKGHAFFKDQPAVLSTVRLITAKDARSLKETILLMKQHGLIQ